MRRTVWLFIAVAALLGNGTLVSNAALKLATKYPNIRLALSTQLPVSDLGKSYSFTFSSSVTGGTGAPYTWKLTGTLPKGLTFSATNARIFGTVSPTASVTSYPLRVCVTGAKRTVSGTQPVNSTCASTKIVVRALMQSPTPTITPASVLTNPPADMTGINDHADVFSTGLDPATVTLGPKVGNRPELQTYAGQIGLVVEVPDGNPVLAPMDMRFIGFNNRNSDYRIASNGVRQEPFDDLEICFESTSKDWPGLIFCTYHMQNSPLLLGINIDPSCSNASEWPGPLRAEGHQFFTDADYILPNTSLSASCKALLGRVVTRGSVIAYAGSTGPHSQAPIRMKVPDKSINPTVVKGDKYLHWVQPDVFFYWKCFSANATFAPGVLAYPFACDGYQVPVEQRSTDFKYQK